MPRGNLFVLRYNGRDDNLGDQFIFRALATALASLGVVRIKGRAATFLPDVRPPTSDWTLGLLSAMTRFQGYSVYDFTSPGARPWTSPPQAAPFTRGWLKSACRKAFLGRRVSVGTSVIPAANHSWCKDVDWIGVRDRASLTALHAAGMQRAEYFPDLAFLPAPPREADVPRGGICVSFRKAILETRNSEGYEPRLSDAFGALASSFTGHMKRQVKSFYQVEEDASFVARLSKSHDIPFEPAQLSLDSFEAFYQSADIVVSNRLHCLLMGAYCGAVPVALTSREHTKVNALFETVGWKSLTLAIEDRDELAQRFAAIQRDLSNLRPMVDSVFQRQRDLGLSILESRFRVGRD